MPSISFIGGPSVSRTSFRCTECGSDVLFLMRSARLTCRCHARREGEVRPASWVTDPPTCFACGKPVRSAALASKATRGATFHYECWNGEIDRTGKIPEVRPRVSRRRVPEHVWRAEEALLEGDGFYDGLRAPNPDCPDDPGGRPLKLSPGEALKSRPVAYLGTDGHPHPIGSEAPARGGPSMEQLYTVDDLCRLSETLLERAEDAEKKASSQGVRLADAAATLTTVTHERNALRVQVDRLRKLLDGRLSDPEAERLRYFEEAARHDWRTKKPPEVSR